MKEYTCIVCPRGCHITVADDKTVTGNSCDKGRDYALSEETAPKRSVSSTVKITGAALRRLPVKTDRPIDKAKVKDAVRALDKVSVSAPIKLGDAVLKNVLGTDVSFVATRSEKRA